MRLAEVLTFERVEEDGAQVALLKVDRGGEEITVYHHGDPGDDAQPLKGDTVVLDESEENAISYADTVNAGIAGPGEKRFYARDSAGAPVVQIHLHSDGSVVVSNENGRFEMAPNGNVTINGVVIDTDGNITSPGDVVASGEVTAMDGPAKVSLSTHTHGHPMGPTAAPNPGT